MEARKLFTGRKQHRREGRVHFAEVTVRAEPCAGESQVVLSGEVLDTLREVFGPDFEHHRHCVWSAVAVMLDTANVAGEMPNAGATSFRAEVVRVEVSGNAGRETSAFLLSVAGMDAIGAYLQAWEDEQTGGTGGLSEEHPRGSSTGEGPQDVLTPRPESFGPDHARVVERVGRMTEFDFRCVTYRTCYVLIRAEIVEARTEAEIRDWFRSTVESAGSHSDAVREALEDALAGRPMRYNDPLGP